MEPHHQLRVTHVMFDFDGGGMESLVAEMARRFRGSWIRMSVVALSGREGRLGASSRPLLESYEYLTPPRFVSMLYPGAVARAIRDSAPDIVHIHSGCWHVGSLAARLADVRKVVFTEHGREFHDPLLWRCLDSRAAARTDAVVAVSSEVASYLRTRVGVSPSKIHTIPNGVDTAKFRPGPREIRLREHLKLPADSIIVGSLGRLEPVKAYDMLLSTVARLNSKLSPRRIACVIWGEGSERERLTALAANLGISEVVRLPGWSQDSVSHHRALDVFVLPSTSEGASISLLESMACGVPPVVTNVGASAYLVGPELASQVVKSGDALALERVVTDTLLNEGRAAELGATARARVTKHFSVEVMIARYAQLYQDILVAPGDRH